MSKVAAARQRSLATCIHIFRDAAETDWLVARVNRREDMVGAVALRALAVINPERALASLSELPHVDLYMTREWCFGELARRLPIEATAWFAARLREHSDPWQFALVLQGQEDIIDPDSFEFLLDRLSELLDVESRSPDPNTISAACRGGIQFLNAVHRPLLLDRLRLRRGSEFERHLTNWLLAVGPQRGMSREYEKNEGLAVLTKIGGDGFSQVIDEWLDRGDWFARMQALPLAQRRATSHTIEILTRLSQGHEDGENEDENRLGVVSGYAAAALSTHGCWAPVIQYYCRVGLRCLNVVIECSSERSPPLTDNQITPALNQIRPDGSATPGSVIAIGFSGRKDLLPMVRGVLHHAEPSSETTRGALSALQWLGDTEPNTVPYVERSVPYHDFYATNTLFVNGSDAAVAALAVRLAVQPDIQSAAFLSSTSLYRETALDCLRQVATGRVRLSANDLHAITQLVSADVLVALANDPEVYAQAEEDAFSPYGGMCFLGEKPAALRIVGLRQPESAGRTALARLQDPNTQDAEHYVPLVVEFCPDSATEQLLEVVVSNPSERVIRAIGRQLCQLRAAETVHTWLADSLPERRLAGCRVAGSLEPTAGLLTAIANCIDDPDRRISNAARAAIAQLRRSEIAAELLCQLILETDPMHRWTLLDVLIDTSDPGVPGNRPNWVATAAAHLTPAMRKHLGKRLQDRAQKVNAEYEKLDRRRN
jgi:hypothetical protein